MSGLELYSLGIVRTSKVRNSNIIEVIPIEELPLIDGEIDSETQTNKMVTTIPDNAGVDKTSKVESDIYLTADWLPLSNSNRMTSPDVIKGETVLIFSFSDTDQYYWTVLFNETNLRRLETVIYAFGNIKSGTERFDIDSSYYLEVSTHDKRVKVHTGNTDGEPYVYDIEIDTKVGTVNINDDINNSISMRSNEGIIETTANAETILNSPKVTVNASEQAVINSPKTICTGDLDVGGNITNSGTLNNTGTISGSSDITAGGNIAAAGTVSGTNI